MKTILAFLTSALVAGTAYCADLTVSIESEDLGVVPQEVTSTITSDSSFDTFKNLRCDIKGKEIHLSSKQSEKTWFVTTVDACGWGAALGPIWLVQDKADGKAVLILSTGGYALSPSTKFHKGLADVTIAAGTASENESKKYSFNGKCYKTMK